MIKIMSVLPGLATASDIDEFITTFKEAFGGPPYYETYSDKEVLEEVWRPHHQHASIVLAHDDATGKVIGFGCSLPLSKAPDDVQDFLSEQREAGALPEDFDPAKTWYMSELGVLLAYRGRGISYDLVRHRLLAVSHSGATHYVMRTAAEGSNSRHLYERIGAAPLAFEQDVSKTEQVTVMGSQSTKRVYLYGRSSEALHEITSRQLAGK